MLKESEACPFNLKYGFSCHKTITLSAQQRLEMPSSQRVTIGAKILVSTVYLGLVRNTPAEFANGGYTMETHQLFSFYIAPLDCSQSPIDGPPSWSLNANEKNWREYKTPVGRGGGVHHPYAMNPTATTHGHFVLSPVSLASTKLNDRHLELGHGNHMIILTPSFSKRFPHETIKRGFSNSSGSKSVFEEERFRT